MPRALRGPRETKGKGKGKNSGQTIANGTNKRGWMGWGEPLRVKVWRKLRCAGAGRQPADTHATAKERKRARVSLAHAQEKRSRHQPHKSRGAGRKMRH